MRSSIYVKLVISFLIVIIPMYLLSLFFTEWASSSMQHEIEQSMQSRAEFYTASLERELTRSAELLREFLYDDDLLMLSVAGSVMTPNERTAAITRIHKRMEILERSSSMNAIVSAYIPAMDRTITSQVMVDDFDPDMFRVLQLQPNEGRIFNIAGHYYIKYSQPRSYFFQKEDPAAILLLQLSEESIRHDLQRIMDADGGGAMLLNSEDQWMIATELSPPFDMAHIDSWLHRQDDDNRLISPINEESYLTSYAQTSFSHLLLYVPEELALEPLRKYQFWLLALSAVSLLVVLLFSYWMYKIIHQPFKRMMTAFRKMRSGYFNIEIMHESSDEFNQLYAQFNDMVDQIQYLLNEVYEKEYLKQQAELKHLQSQINPHFLYNSFFILNRMIAKEDLEQANSFSNHLGKYFRYITKLDREDVPLSAEIEFISSYTDIQSVRFSNRIQVKMTPLPDEMRNVIIPKLSIQPIIENAFVHGFKKTTEGGLLHIKFRKEANKAIVIVQDNGMGMSEQELHKLRKQFSLSSDVTLGSGLFNVHRRLQMKQGKEAGLHVKHNEFGGLTVEIHFVTQEELEDASTTDRR